jgi:peroxiredoxin
MPKISINALAPDFELPDFSGRPVRLSGLRGRNVLLIFNRGFM